MAKEQSVGRVLETTNYSRFKKLTGNRGVATSRVNAIGKSIDENGWICNPILVNEKMEIIDGQGRFEALRARNMPIQYVIAYGTTVDECRALNVRQINWSTKDFVKSYADMGNISYKYLCELLKEFKEVRMTGVVSAGALVPIGGYHRRSGIGNGSFTMTEEQYQTVRKRLEYCRRVLAELGAEKVFAPVDMICAIAAFIYEHPKTDNELLLKRISINKRDPEFFLQCRRIMQVANEFTKVYNYRTSNAKKVLINYEYEQWRMTRPDEAQWFGEVK